jgi:hypothetical protein
MVSSNDVYYERWQLPILGTIVFVMLLAVGVRVWPFCLGSNRVNADIHWKTWRGVSTGSALAAAILCVGFTCLSGVSYYWNRQISDLLKNTRPKEFDDRMYTEDVATTVAVVMRKILDVMIPTPVAPSSKSYIEFLIL